MSWWFLPVIVIFENWPCIQAFQ